MGDASTMADSRYAHDCARNGLLVLIGAAVLWFLLGVWQVTEYMRYSDYQLHPDKAPAGISNPTDLIMFSAILAGMFIIFGIAALILALLVNVSVLGPMARQEHEMAARYLPNLGMMGYLFGIGVAGHMLRKSFRSLRESRMADIAPQVQTVVAEATPVCPACGSPATFIHGQQRWHCGNCARFL